MIIAKEKKGTLFLSMYGVNRNQRVMSIFCLPLIGWVGWWHLVFVSSCTIDSVLIM